MKLISSFILCAGSLLPQAFGQQMSMPQGPAIPNLGRYQPTYDDLKATLNLSDDQLTQLKQMQTDKMASTQAFYSKMSEKQKELNQLLESNGDATKVGQAMIELQQMRKQPPPGAADVHDRAVAILNDVQKQKLGMLEEAQKSRASIDQAIQLSLLSPPAAPKAPPGGIMPMPMPANTAKPATTDTHPSSAPHPKP